MTEQRDLSRQESSSAAAPHSLVTQFVLYNWKLLATVGAVVVLIVLAVGAYRSHQQKMVEKERASVFEFGQTVWKEYQDKKITAADLQKRWGDFSTKIEAKEVLFPQLFQMALTLKEAGDVQASYDLLSLHIRTFKDEPNLYFFLSNFYAAVCEDLNRHKEAIGVLEELIQMDLKIGEAKNYFDLGRNYWKAGIKEKAKSNFEYVVKTFPQNEYANLAKVYLKKI